MVAEQGASVEAQIDTYEPHGGRHTVGSSDVAVILGASKFADASAFARWAQLSGLAPYRAGADTSYHAFGRWLEGPLIQRYAEGLPDDHVVEPNTLRFVGLHPWMHAVPDALVSGTVPEGCDISPYSWVLDVKTSRDDPWEELPTYYVLQGMWQSMCSHRGRADFFALFLWRSEFRTYTVPRDIELERRVREQVWAWSHRHVVLLEPPEPDDSKAASRALAGLYGRVVDEDRALEADDSDLATVQRLRLIKERLAELDAEKTLLTNQLRQKTGRAKAKVLRAPDGTKLAGWTKDGKFLISKAR